MFDLIKVAIDKALDVKQLFILFCGAIGSFLLHSLAVTKIETLLSAVESGLLYFGFFCLSGLLGHVIICIGNSVWKLLTTLGKCIKNKHQTKNKKLEYEKSIKQKEIAQLEIIDNLRNKLLTSLPHMDEEDSEILFYLSSIDTISKEETYEIQHLKRAKFITYLDRLPNDEVIIRLNPDIEQTIKDYLKEASYKLIKNAEESWGEEAIQNTLKLFEKQYHNNMANFEIFVLDQSDLFQRKDIFGTEKSWDINHIIFWNLSVNTSIVYYKTTSNNPTLKGLQTAPPP